VIAVDIEDAKLDFARTIGAEVTINSSNTGPVKAILDVTEGGAHISIDALGHPEILMNSVSSLRKRGKHIQVGIMEAGQHNSPVPIDKIIGRELEIIGSHGMRAGRYPEMLDLMAAAKLQPQKLIGRTITLSEAGLHLIRMNASPGIGVTLIDLGNDRKPEFEVAE